MKHLPRPLALTLVILLVILSVIAGTMTLIAFGWLKPWQQAFVLDASVAWLIFCAAYLLMLAEEAVRQIRGR